MFLKCVPKESVAKQSLASSLRERREAKATLIAPLSTFFSLADLDLPPFPLPRNPALTRIPFDLNTKKKQTNNSSIRRPLVAAFASRGDENGSDENDDKEDEEKEEEVDLDAPPSGAEAAGALSLPLAGADTDWREFRAQLVGATKAASANAAGEAAALTSSGASTSSSSSPSPLAQASRSRSRSASSSSSSASSSSSSSSSSKLWAHPLSRPERGCILVAHPLLFTSAQTYFSKSVVFLIEHDNAEETSVDDGDRIGARLQGGGTCGLILNKPTTLTLSDVGGGVSPLLPAFGGSTLHLGGDVERQSLHVLHGVAGLAGSLEVVSGVRVGGVDAAAQAVAEGRARAGDFKFLHGYCGWSPGQLEREFRSGVWFAAAASSEVLLRGAALAATAEAAEEERDASSPSSPSLRSGGDSMWHAVLELMGGEHAEMSRALRQSAAQQQQRPPPPPGGGGGGGGGGDEERR